MRRLLARRYLEHALGVKVQVPWSVAARLFATGLFDSPEMPSPVDAQVLKALGELSSVTGDPPLFLKMEPSQPGEPIPFIEIADSLSARNLAVASAAAPIVVRTIDHYAGPQGARELVRDYESAVHEKDLSRALYCAAALDEALSSDWEWQVALLGQAAREGLDEICRRQIGRLLRLDPAEPEILDYLQKGFSAAVSAVTESEGDDALTLEQAIAYLQKVGPYVAHIPWRDDAGFSGVLSRVTDDEIGVELWPYMLQWLANDKPAWWLHVWITAMKFPRVVPEDGWSGLWDRIALLSIESSEGQDSSAAGKGVVPLYEQLLTFYFHRIEVALPGARSEFVMWSASKLASDISSALDGFHGETIDEIIEKASEDAKFVWQIVSPTCAPNELRAAFLDYGRYWPVAIVASIRSWADSPDTPKVPESIQPILGSLVQIGTVRLAATTPIRDASDKSMTLACMTGVSDRWQHVLPLSETLGEWLTAYAHFTEKFSSVDAVVERFRAPMNYEDVEGLIAILRWASFVKAGRISMDSVLATLSDNEWLATVEPTIRPDELERVFGALLSAPWVGRPTLRVELPHWAARRCISSLSDEDRRKAYCVATVLLSLKGGTGSAIARLLHEDQQNVLMDDRRNLSDALRRSLDASPAWVRGRIGSVLALLDE